MKLLVRTAALATAGLLLTLPMTATAATLPAASSTEDAATTQGATTAEGNQAVEQAQLLLLMDASHSMADPDADGEPKIDAARTALTTLIDGLNPDQQVGLRVFGGEVPIDQPTEAKCTDSQLVVPIASGNTSELTAAVDDYTPTGETPIGYALQQAADDLGPDGNRTVLLVSDGIATCDPDPCEVAEQLTADGLDLVVHTVGLGADDATRTQLQCIADAAGGTYYDTDDTDSLTSALHRVSSRAFRPFTVQGTPVVGTTDTAGGPELTPGGQYTDTFGVPEQSKYYTIQRTSPGTAIYVGASAQPAFDTTAMAELRLETTDGERCASTRITAGTDIATTSVMSGAVHINASQGPSGADDQCQQADELRLAVMTVGNYRGTEGVPFEMLIKETPALSDAPIPEVGSLPGWTPMEVSEPQEIVPGTSFNDAAPVDPGTSYAVDIMPGEVLFFQMPATFGQAVQMQVDSDPGQMSQAQLDSLGMGRLLVRKAYTPERGHILNQLYAEDGIASLDGDGNMIIGPDPESGATSSGQIRFSNSTASQAAFTEGDYYMSLAFDPGTSSTPVPLTVTFDVVGEAVPGPATVETLGQDTEASTVDTDAAQTSEAMPLDESDTQAPDTDQPEDAAAGTETDETGMPWAWLLGGAGVLVAAAGVFLLGWRRA